MKYGSAAIGVIAGLSIVFVAWRIAQPSSPTMLVVIVADGSESVPEPCKAVVGIAANEVEVVRSTKGSDIVVLWSGSRRRAMEAELLDMPRAPQRTGRYLERSKKAVVIDTYLDSVETICAAAPPLRVSSIYLAARRGVEMAKASKAKRTRVIVSTDLQETALDALRLALKNGAINTAPETIERIDNRGVQVVFCGYASTIGADSAAGRSLTKSRATTDPQRILSIWTSLLSDSSNVEFAPYCPKRAVSQAAQAP